PRQAAAEIALEELALRRGAAAGRGGADDRGRPHRPPGARLRGSGMLDPAAGAWPILATCLVGGYLLGSIPFGLIFTRLAGLGDVRAIGSGNIGATNVLRTGRKGIAAATLLGDMLKGTAAVAIAALWGPQFAIVAGLGAFFGHLFPVWLGFKGGK